MAILAFQKPEKVVMLEADNHFGKFEFRPLEPGYGVTIGNALRRILVSSLEGFAIIGVKIEGVDHEFSSIPGVIEDVTEIVLNLKKVRLKNVVPDFTEETINVTIMGKEQFVAGDLNKYLSNFQVLNQDLVICNMTKDVKLQMIISINKGRGYVPADENREEFEKLGIGAIAIDSIYTPILNVSYQVDNYRVEQKTDYERLTIEIKTDGSIAPLDALKDAARILIQHFSLFTDDMISMEAVESFSGDEFNEEALRMRQLLKSKLSEHGLSVRALNCLKAADVETIGELVTYNRSDLLKFRNFGKKSLTELDDFLVTQKLSFGMDITKYKLDKE